MRCAAVPDVDVFDIATQAMDSDQSKGVKCNIERGKVVIVDYILPKSDHPVKREKPDEAQEANEVGVDETDSESTDPAFAVADAWPSMKSSYTDLLALESLKANAHNTIRAYAELEAKIADETSLLHAFKN